MSTRSFIAMSTVKPDGIADVLFPQTWDGNAETLKFRSIYHHSDGYPDGLGETLNQFMMLEDHPEWANWNESPEEGSLIHAMQAAKVETKYAKRKFILEWLFSTSRVGWSSIVGDNPSLIPMGREAWNRPHFTEGNREWIHYGNMVGYGLGNAPEFLTPVQLAHGESATLCKVCEGSWYEYGYAFVFDETTQQVTMITYKVNYIGALEPIEHNHREMARRVYTNESVADMLILKESGYLDDEDTEEIEAE